MEYEELLMNAPLIRLELEHMLSAPGLTPEQVQKLESAIAQMDEICA